LLAGCLRRLAAQGAEAQDLKGQSHHADAAIKLYENSAATLARAARLSDSDTSATDLASVHNDWGVALWQRGGDGDAEAALAHCYRALALRRRCRGEVRSASEERLLARKRAPFSLHFGGATLESRNKRKPRFCTLRAGAHTRRALHETKPSTSSYFSTRKHFCFSPGPP
jgi:hypothetical protein